MTRLAAFRWKKNWISTLEVQKRDSDPSHRQVGLLTSYLLPNLPETVLQPASDSQACHNSTGR